MPWRRPDLRRDTTRQRRRPTDAMELLVKAGRQRHGSAAQAPRRPLFATTTSAMVRQLRTLYDHGQPSPHPGRDRDPDPRVPSRRRLGRFIPVQRCIISQMRVSVYYDRLQVEGFYEEERFGHAALPLSFQGVRRIDAVRAVLQGSSAGYFDNATGSILAGRCGSAALIWKRTT